MPQGLQYPGHPGFTAPDEPYDCGRCIASHATRFSFPTLGEENVEAWTLWQTAHAQQRSTGGMEPVFLGIDFQALAVLFDIYAIPRLERQGLFEKILLIDRAAEKQRADERKAERLRREAEAKYAREHGEH